MSALLSKDLVTNRETLQTILADCADVVFRPVAPGGRTRGLLVFVEGMVDSARLTGPVLQALLRPGEPLQDDEVPVAGVSSTDTYDGAVEAILAGEAVWLVEGNAFAQVLHVRGGERRAVAEPTAEQLVRGPREGFTESLRTNTSLLRFKIQSPALKMVARQIGTETRTTVMLAYLEGITDPKVVTEVKERLGRIQIDGVLASGYIEELIEDEPFSPFPQLHYSERPDTVAARLLEGRFAILVDGTPVVLTGPTTFWELMQASEDYYERALFATALRWLRYLFLGIALYFPSLYIAVTTFHHDMLPTNLLLSVAAAREGIPFPALVEALIMEISFEALREAGIRLPQPVGQAVGILGALVIGQATVQAGIVSAPMVIVVALTGIASFTIPRFNAAIAIRLLRFPMMFLAAAFGLFGIVLGTFWMGLHLCTLFSFGVPYLAGVAPASTSDLKDILVRAPWWARVRRPSYLSRRNRRRMADGLKPGSTQGRR